MVDANPTPPNLPGPYSLLTALDPSATTGFAGESWRQLLASAVRTPAEMPLSLTSGPAAALESVAAAFPMCINAYFLSLIKTANDPLGRQVLPHRVELKDRQGPLDPLGEDAQSPVPQVIHRYPGRINFLVSNQCAVYCRFCMRKRRVGSGAPVSPDHIQSGVDYIERHSAINEVILSGGDPFMLEDDRLLGILHALRQIPHVRVLRIHTRMPVALPQRFHPSLVQALAQYRPLYINVHINHPAELTPQASAACQWLADAGIPLGSQTVLLKGVNDTTDTLATLMEALLTNRIRPYYLHQLDRVPGTAHFQVPLTKSIGLVSTLRGRLSGMAVPHLMVDLPQGGGKVALTPEVVVHKGRSHWKIRNWQGVIYRCPV